MLEEKTHRFCSSFDCLRSYPVYLHKNTANLTDSKLQFFPLQKYGKNEWWAKLRNCSAQLVRNNVCELLFPHFFPLHRRNLTRTNKKTQWNTKDSLSAQTKTISKITEKISFLRRIVFDQLTPFFVFETALRAKRVSSGWIFCFVWFGLVSHFLFNMYWTTFMLCVMSNFDFI